MKKCNRCNQDKQTPDFHMHSAMCKKCRSLHDKVRDPRSKCKNNSDAARARKRRWQKANYDPMKNSARNAVRTAIEYGRLTKPDECSVCGLGAKRSDGVSAIQAHHDDYAKPLDVMWLCPKCHKKRHEELDAKSANDNWPEDADEYGNRMAVVGQNGNDGLAYQEEQP